MDAVDGGWVRAALPGFFSPLEGAARVPTTMARAAELASSGAPEGATVVAEEQTEGRGRLGRAWVAPPGSSLLLSVVLRPPLAREAGWRAGAARGGGWGCGGGRGGGRGRGRRAGSPGGRSRPASSGPTTWSWAAARRPGCW